MRIERWYWLGYFCVLSFLIHIGLVLKSRAFTINVPEGQKAGEIEVALQPPDPVKPKEPPKPKVKPVEREKPRPKPKEERLPSPPPHRERQRVAAYKRERVRPQPIRIARNTEKATRRT